jgi:hypothetical protein
MIDRWQNALNREIFDNFLNFEYIYNLPKIQEIPKNFIKQNIKKYFSNKTPNRKIKNQKGQKIILIDNFRKVKEKHKTSF